MTRSGPAGATRALFRGEWRDWLDYDEPGAGRFAGLCRLVAASMKAQALGDPARAWRLLGHAAEVLPWGSVTVTHPRGLTAWPAGRVVRLAVLTPRPAVGSNLDRFWMTSLLVWREQQELIDLCRRVHPERATPRDVLIEAGIEVQRWCTCDPQWAGCLQDGLPDDVWRRAVMRDRATLLRQFAEPRAGDISLGVWDDIGRGRGLHGATLDRLATTPLVPWSTGRSGMWVVHVRCGRQEAGERAWRRHANLAAGN